MSAPPKRSLFRGVLLPAGFVAAGSLLAALFLSTFLTAHAWLLGGAIAAALAYAGSRVLRHYARPPVWGPAAGLALVGVAAGAGALALLNALFTDGPGWPLTPWWALAGGLGMGLQRAWRPVHQAKKDAIALGLLLGGLLLTGFAALALFRAFAPGGAASQRVLLIGATMYALHGARLLLGFSAEEREGKPGFAGWLRANALQNAVLVLLLVGYLAFREPISSIVPYFPLVEFGLAVAVFGFALQRLRARLKREETELATASTARQHERIVTELREWDYDSVARPVAQFVETGRGVEDYATAVSESALLAPDDAAAALAPARAYREPPVLPPLPLQWALLSVGLTALGFGVTAGVSASKLFGADVWGVISIALAVLAAGAYAAQDQLRSRLRPWEAVALAAGATLALALVLWFGLGRGAVPSIVGYMMLAGAAVMIGVSALSSWRLVRRTQRGESVGAREPAGTLLDRQASAARRRVTIVVAGLLVLFLPVRFLGRWLSGRGWIPDLIPVILDDVLGIAVWAAIGLAGAAAVRWWGLTRHRPTVVAEEQARRAHRLSIHVDVMRHIERT